MSVLRVFLLSISLHLLRLALAEPEDLAFTNEVFDVQVGAAFTVRWNDASGVASLRLLGIVPSETYPGLTARVVVEIMAESMINEDSVRWTPTSSIPLCDAFLFALDVRWAQEDGSTILKSIDSPEFQIEGLAAATPTIDLLPTFAEVTIDVAVETSTKTQATATPTLTAETTKSDDPSSNTPAEDTHDAIDTETQSSEPGPSDDPTGSNPLQPSGAPPSDTGSDPKSSAGLGLDSASGSDTGAGFGFDSGSGAGEGGTEGASQEPDNNTQTTWPNNSVKNGLSTGAKAAIGVVSSVVILGGAAGVYTLVKGPMAVKGALGKGLAGNSTNTFPGDNQSNVSHDMPGNRTDGGGNGFNHTNNNLEGHADVERGGGWEKPLTNGGNCVVGMPPSGTNIVTPPLIPPWLYLPLALGNKRRDKEEQESRTETKAELP